MSQVPHNAAMVLPNSTASSGPLYTLQDLPKSHFEDTNTECNICRCADAADVDNADAALPTQIVRIDLCSHIFHRICLLTWLNEQTRNNEGTCPMCRIVLVSSTRWGTQDILETLRDRVRVSVDAELLTSIQAEFETELNTLREEVASAQTILHNEQLLRTLDQEAAAHAFHQVELFQTEMSERIMEARLYQDADPARSQQLEQEIQDMRPRMGELGTAFTRANMRVNETHMQVQNLEFEIRILSNDVLHLQIVCQTIRETLLSLASSVDQAQA